MSAEISLCMISRSDEEHITRCLDSVTGIVDEINIVFNGDKNGKAIASAAKYTDRIFYDEWTEHFANARNLSFSKATKEFVMWLDADNVIMPEDRAKLLKLKKCLSGDIDYVIMPYISVHQNRRESLPRKRIVRREAGFLWSGAVHESLDAGGSGIVSDAAVTQPHTDGHDADSTERNFRILEREIKNGSARMLDYYYYGKTLFKFGRSDEALQALRVFLDSPERLNYDLPDLYITIHNIYKTQKNYAAAIKALTENEKLLRGKSEYYTALGTFFSHELAAPTAAIPLFERALRCEAATPSDPGFAGIAGIVNENYYYHQPLLCLAECQMALGLYAQAAESLRKTLAYNSSTNSEIEEMAEHLEAMAKQGV